jgi:hypothetical protein
MCFVRFYCIYLSWYKISILNSILSRIILLIFSWGGIGPSTAPSPVSTSVALVYIPSQDRGTRASASKHFTIVHACPSELQRRSAEEIVSCSWYSTKREKQARKFCWEVEEDVTRGGEATQSTRARFTLHHWWARGMSCQLRLQWFHSFPLLTTPPINVVHPISDQVPHIASSGFHRERLLLLLLLLLDFSCFSSKSKHQNISPASFLIRPLPPCPDSSPRAVTPPLLSPIHIAIAAFVAAPGEAARCQAPCATPLRLQHCR